MGIHIRKLGISLLSIASITLLIAGCRGGSDEQPVTDLDVVILNGRVMDPETEYDQVANVGIKDGRIAVITQDAIQGRQTIDASGHVVAPGFIDTHFHWQAPLGYKIGLRDGLTSSMDFEEAALRAINRWSFRPYLYKDRPLPVRVAIRFAFKE